MKRSRLAGAIVIFALSPSTTRFVTSAQSNEAPSGWQDRFDVNKSDLLPTGTNPYITMQPGRVLDLKHRNDRLTVTILPDTQDIDGVKAGILEERETKSGTLVEVSRNFMATDKNTGDVYYLGEDVDNYKNGKLVNHESAWRAGVAGARFGLMIPAKPVVGEKFYQEIAPKVAMDRVEVVSIDETVKTPAGVFEHCVHLRETTPLERDVSHKYYAPGVGIIKDDEFELAERPGRPGRPLTFAGQPNEEQETVRVWIENVRSHEPGTIDHPLREVANQPTRTFDLVCYRLDSMLSRTTDLRERNDIRRRGALLHTDIAMLLPERAAYFTQADLILTMRRGRNSQPNQRQGQGDSLVLAADGEYVSSAIDSAHWWMASYLLRDIQPHANEDPFVAAWNRAIAAFFESRYLYGSANHHLSRALMVLPADPALLFYAGTIHEAYASANVQNVGLTRPTSVRPPSVSPAADEWRQAEKYFRESVKFGGSPEARLRLARVKGQLGDHAEAATMLRDVVTTLTDPRLQYLGYLFLGSEEGALGHVDESRHSFERAAEMQATAQSPLLGLAEMYRRTGNLSAAQETLQRLAALPDDPRRRDEPYIDYFRSFAFDADEQLAAVRAMIKEAR